jgi:hypothetical protein
MSNYSENYLEVSTVMYKPMSRNLSYAKAGGYVLSEEYTKRLIKIVGDSGYILFNHFYKKSSYRFFIPTDNKKLADGIGWSVSKVERIKTLLVKKGYLLILKDTGNDGCSIYRVLLGTELINHYKDTGHLPNDVDTTIKTKKLHSEPNTPIKEDVIVITKKIKPKPKQDNKTKLKKLRNLLIDTYNFPPELVYELNYDELLKRYNSL